MSNSYKIGIKIEHTGEKPFKL